MAKNLNEFYQIYVLLNTISWNKNSIKEKKSYETLFKLLHYMLKNEVKNTYLESFYGVKEYVEKKIEK